VLLFAKNRLFRSRGPHLVLAIGPAAQFTYAMRQIISRFKADELMANVTPIDCANVDTGTVKELVRNSVAKVDETNKKIVQLMKSLRRQGRVGTQSSMPWRGNVIFSKSEWHNPAYPQYIDLLYLVSFEKIDVDGSTFLITLKEDRSLGGVSLDRTMFVALTSVGYSTGSMRPI
jgi:hypothetical protein